MKKSSGPKASDKKSKSDFYPKHVNPNSGMNAQKDLVSDFTSGGKKPPAVPTKP
jgi:hypothetical protein